VQPNIAYAVTPQTNNRAITAILCHWFLPSMTDAPPSASPHHLKTNEPPGK
jgi:hypothetical protein